MVVTHLGCGPRKRSGEKMVENGATFNGAMPSFGPRGSNWKDVKIGNGLTYIRQEWGIESAGGDHGDRGPRPRFHGARGKVWSATAVVEFHPAAK